MFVSCARKMSTSVIRGGLGFGGHLFDSLCGTLVFALRGWSPEVEKQGGEYYVV